MIDVGPLTAELEDVAALLLTSAFVDEPYVVEMHGDDPLVRWSNKHARHTEQVPEYGLRLLATADGAPAGVLLGSYSGACAACARPHLESEGPLDHQWYDGLKAAHARQPAHGWVGKLGVAPALQGRGVARALLAAAADEVRSAGGTLLLLECQPHREAFYTAAGYTTVELLPDPAGPDAPLMRRTL